MKKTKNHLMADSFQMAKRSVERVLKVRVMRSVPHGTELMRDVARSLSSLRIRTVLDVGANVGQTAAELLADCPGAHIHCFEPMGATFAKLQERFSDDRRVACWKLAMGRAPATVLMSQQNLSVTSRIADLSLAGAEPEGKTEQVEMSTVSLFCDRHRINEIGLLKIDTEGHDLEVLEGARELLAKQMIHLVQAEVGMNPGNTLHVPFETMCQFMSGHGCHLFGIYNQALEWPTAEPRLRRADAVFVSDAAIAANRRVQRV